MSETVIKAKDGRDIFAVALTDWLVRNEGVAHTFEPVTTEKKEAE